MSGINMYYSSEDGSMPSIELVPMAQRLNIKNRKEDWTGKSDTALRRKLQNRLNQRASRARRKQAELQNRRSPTSESVTADKNSVASRQDLYASAVAYESDSDVSQTSSLIKRPRWPVHWCAPQLILESMTQIRDFQSFQYQHFPNDQKGLTSIHFNLVRALHECVNTLGFHTNELYLDPQFPFIETQNLPDYPSTIAQTISTPPPTTQSINIQRPIPHHPEYDVFPFPRYRDNVILALLNKAIGQSEFCMDICYGVGNDSIWPNRANAGKGGENEVIPSGSKTGFIVWSDPWLQSSWEIEEAFARKYDFLFEGCDELMASTNYWRESRGESSLTFWPFDTIGSEISYGSFDGAGFGF